VELLEESMLVEPMGPKLVEPMEPMLVFEMVVDKMMGSLVRPVVHSVRLECMRKVSEPRSLMEPKDKGKKS
jgi:hypothetical protein